MPLRFEWHFRLKASSIYILPDAAVSNFLFFRSYEIPEKAKFITYIFSSDSNNSVSLGSDGLGASALTILPCGSIKINLGMPLMP